MASLKLGIHKLAALSGFVPTNALAVMVRLLVESRRAGFTWHLTRLPEIEN